ncbi:MAG TPA: hypothetical protein VGR07_22620 [Thermoanaerobaculia bacterium]|jgi:hypothetical protein|nr:hypothetical protein [Thermoanaerobaculia bacterium]
MSDDTSETRDEAVDPADQGELDETWRVVRTVGTEEEATVAIGFLNSNDIPAEAESLHIRELPVDFGDMSQVRIRVPVERADEAIALLGAQDEAAPIFAEGETAESAESALSAEIAPADASSYPETK